jgi:protocatechuate 3,4-dioxygenase beta subunit
VVPRRFTGTRGNLKSVTERRINRRQALAGFGSVSLGALLAACGGNSGGGGGGTPVATADGGTATVEPTSTPSSDLAGKFDAAATCAQTAELTEGPYYLDVDAIRRDIRDDREGVPLRLALRVRGGNECAPLKDAVVDIWHCDAGGVYSGVQGDNERFLRGTQVTDADGIAEFLTVYPGWYQGRTVHIHAKVHVDTQTLLTTQLFFDEAVSARVYEREPYTSHGAPDQGNASDGIFDQSLVLTLEEDGDGYLGLMTFDVVRIEA